MEIKTFISGHAPTNPHVPQLVYFILYSSEDNQFKFTESTQQFCIVVVLWFYTQNLGFFVHHPIVPP